MPLRLKGAWGGVSICHCNGKKGSKSSYSHAFRALLWCWDILAAARIRVTRIGQSAEDRGFEKDKHMIRAWQRLWHSIAPGRKDPRGRASEKGEMKNISARKSHGTSIATAALMAK